MVASYPNFFLLMGPNSVTGHSSALFNTECTVDMMAHLLKPVVKQLKARSGSSGEEREGPAPSVEVTQAAEDEWYAKMRAQMAKMVWEVDGGIVRPSLSVVLDRSALTQTPLAHAQSWYVDPSIGKCTTLCASRSSSSFSFSLAVSLQYRD